MVWNILIADDLETDRIRLEKDLREWFKDRDEAEITCYPDGESLMKEFSKGAFHLAFLDIQMGENKINGIELAQWLREIDTQMLVVFLTTSAEYAFDAFPIHPFDYLIKPYDSQTLDRVMQEALRVLTDKEPEVSIRVARSDIRIPLRRILSAVAQGHNVEISIVEGESLRSNMTFSEIERQLSADPRFLTCNRGVLVNMDQVLSLTENTIQMTNGASYPLRTKGRTELLAAFSQYQISRMKRGAR